MTTYMRGHVGDLVFQFEDGKAERLWLYREWRADGGPDLVKGQEVRLALSIVETRPGVSSVGLFVVRSTGG